VDFGADVPFDQVGQKLMEHYGIQVAKSAARLITYKHARVLQQIENKAIKTPIDPGNNIPKVVVSATDACMIPIVTPPAVLETSDSQPLTKQDRRKKKQLGYQEARLTLAHAQDSATLRFSATMGNVEEVGKRIKHCVELIGFGDETHVHAVGDGAVWIADQVEEQFGCQATYLVDFYHLCEYLSAAAQKIAGNDKAAWMERQKTLMKQGEVSQVLAALNPFLEEDDVPESDAPVRACYRYMTNRPDQLDYKGAIRDKLPIGSGEIESAHRYIIQKRLKLPGSWWLAENANVMLALRTARANNNWQKYWKNAA
jgi:hypothetical protein